MEGDIVFGAEYAIDESSNRPWVEGEDGSGIGESLYLLFPEETTVQVIDVTLGYARSSELYTKNNRPRMILTKAGLKDDPDTYAFLSGMLFESSTFTSYKSHTSESAMHRLYQILQPVSTQKKLGKKSGMQEKNGQLLFSSWPATNHEAAQITGWIRVRPHQCLKIGAAHGVRGKIIFSRDAMDEKSKAVESNEPQNK